MTLEQLIVDMQPFSDDLKNWIKKNPKFLKALKVVYPQKYVTLQAVSISYPPGFDDEAIGVYTFAYRLQRPKFNQDFIVNLGHRDTEFVLYTGGPGSNQGKHVRHINEFFRTYGVDGRYAKTHHPTFKELPAEMHERARDAIALGTQLRANGTRTLTEVEIGEAYDKLKAMRSQDGS